MNVARSLFIDCYYPLVSLPLCIYISKSIMREEEITTEPGKHCQQELRLTVVHSFDQQFESTSKHFARD